MGFDEKSVNSVQLEAVKSTSKRLLLLSGAGSGKTHTIISRIIYLLDVCNVNPKSILALTFSNKAAGEIEERVARCIPNLQPGEITVKTFHKLGSFILRLFGDKIGLDRHSFSIYDDSDSLELLKSLYPDSKKTELKEPMKAILEAKDRGFDSSNYLEYRASKEEYKDIFEKYDSALRLTGNVDFADLINLPIYLLTNNEDVRAYINNRFVYVFVDEYQDMNKTQFEFLKLLVNDDTNLCVVGDDDQSIYSFRGADVDYILNFTDTFSQSQILTLDQNYRSSKKILSLANSLIKNNKARHEKVLWTENVDGDMPTLLKFSSSSQEAYAVAELIKKAQDYSNTAIIYRTNAQGREFETELNSRQIPYKILKSNSFYDKEAVKDAISYITFAYNPIDLVSFSRIASKPAKGLGKSALEKLESVIISKKLNVFDALISLNPSEKVSATMKAFKDNIESAKASLEKNDKVKFFEYLYKNTGFIEYYQERDKKESNSPENSHIFAIKSLVQTLMNINGGKEEMLELLENIALRSSQDVDDKDGVTLATMHAVKGLEFDTCYIVGMEDELIPSSRNSYSQKSIEEERRLFYVAITRARKKLYITYSLRRMIAGHFGPSAPSRFLRELDDRYYRLGSDSVLDGYFSKYQSVQYYKKSQNKAPINYSIYSKQSIDSSSAEDLKKSLDSYKANLDIINKDKNDAKKSQTKADVKSIYSIGDEVFYKKLNIDGKVTNLRKLGGHVIVDIQLSNGQKTSLVDNSKLIERK